MTYEESKELKPGDVLVVNQRLHSITSIEHDGIEVWRGDEVVFRKSVEIDDGNNKHTFLVVFREDLSREKKLGKTMLYGEFPLSNDQVDLTVE